MNHPRLVREVYFEMRRVPGKLLVL